MEKNLRIGIDCGESVNYSNAKKSTFLWKNLILHQIVGKNVHFGSKFVENVNSCAGQVPNEECQ